MARVPTLERDDLPEEYQPLLATEETAGFGHVLNLNRAIANNPPLLRSFVLWARTLLGECGLDERERELVILRIATGQESMYEWHQHAPVALDAGVSEAEIRQLRAGDFDRFDDREAVLLEYVRGVMERSVDDDLAARVHAHVDDRTVVGITLLVSHFLGTAHVIDALDVTVEGEFVGWDLAGL